MNRFVCVALFLLTVADVRAQYSPEHIKSGFVMQTHRDNLRKNLYNYTIQQSFALPLNKETEYRYQSACWAITQFMVYNDIVRSGFFKMINAYHDSLETETRRAFLEAMYAVKPTGFLPKMANIARIEKHPKLMAMATIWVVREDPSSLPEMKLLVSERIRLDTANMILSALQLFLDQYGRLEMVPSIHDLFAHQFTHGAKVVYSFQNRNRDYPGIAVIQKNDGSFEREADGQLSGFGQLARSASGLPYFITNGNTPQGIYAVTGTGTSGNNFIGPTPNLQLAMPFEYYWKDFFLPGSDSLQPESAYQDLLPDSWKHFSPVQESFKAGKIGRTEIIAHGTTIDPEFFSSKSFYPFTPTLGCLCSKEIWDPASGKLKESEQLKLVNGYIRTPEKKGYLIVIDYFNQKRALTRADIEPFVNSFEQKYKR
jgi:hypothetical protein